MKPLHRFLDLSFPDRTLILHALFLVAVVRIALWLVPFRILYRLLEKVAPCRGCIWDLKGIDQETARIAWAVTAVSRFVPEATCLTQALAVQAFLQRRRLPARLRIGVCKGDGTRFAAHAWVESRGRVVVGGPDVEHFVPLLTLGE